MAKFNVTDPNSGKTVTLTSQDNTPPSEQELEQVFGQIGSSATPSTPQEQPIFTESNIEPTQTQEQAPLDLGQDFIMSLAPNDKVRMRYLAEKFAGSQIDQDDEGRIRVDGRYINPQGFQFGADVVGNLGYALPVIAQIWGGVTGGTAGSVVPGAGTAAGAMTGAVVAGTAAEGARVGFGSLLGLKPSVSDVAGSMATEGALSLGGELATRGVVAGVRKGAKVTGADRVLANAWKGTMNKLKGLAPDAAQFLGGVEKDAVKTAQKHGFNNTFTPDNFAEDRMQRIVKRTLFQDPDVNLLTASQVGSDGVQEGSRLLAKSIQQVDDDAYNALVKRYSGLSDESIEVLRKTPLGQVFSKANLSDDVAFKIAEDFEFSAQKKLMQLGKELGRVESAAIRNSRTKTMAVDDIGQKLSKFISSLKGDIRVKGFTKAESPSSIPGLDILESMRNKLGGFVKDPVTGKSTFRFFGEEITSKGGKVLKVLDRPSLKQLSKRLASIDADADSLFLNRNVPREIKGFTKDWLREIRGRYQEILGTKDQNAVFSAFKDVIQDAKIDRASFVSSFENQVKNYRKISGANRNAMNTVLDNLDPIDAKRIRGRVDLANTASELKKFNTQEAVSKLESSLNKKGIISTVKNQTTDEAFLRQIDQGMRNSTSSKARGLGFMNDVEMSLAAKEFLKGSPNLLRIGTLTSMLGGFKLGGPVGALAGIAVSQPRNIARMLSGLEKGVSVPQPLKQGLQTATQAVPTATTGLLSRLLQTQQTQGQ